MDVACQLVAELYPDARAAWLGGSVVRGDATPSSDLDITVLLAGPPAPRRRSIEYGGWPVELFVHTDKSLQHFREKDQVRRQPSLARLIGESVILVDADGSGAQLQHQCLAEIAAGPRPLTTDELDQGRYGITDLIDDLVDASGDLRLALARCCGRRPRASCSPAPATGPVLARACSAK